MIICVFFNVFKEQKKIVLHKVIHIKKRVLNNCYRCLSCKCNSCSVVVRLYLDFNQAQNSFGEFKCVEMN